METLYDLINDEVVSDQLWEIPSSPLMSLRANANITNDLVVITGGQFVECTYLTKTIQLSPVSQSINARFFRERIKTYRTDYGSISIAFQSGELLNEPPFTEYILPTYVAFYTGSIFETIVTSSIVDNTVNTVNAYFHSGSIFDTILTSSAGDVGINITNVAFHTGSIFDIVLATSGNDTGSVAVTFVSGTLFNQAMPTSGNDTGLNTLNVSFLSGYIS